MTTQLYLVPDGNKYHLKITDKALSRDRNCGAPVGQSGQLILNDWSLLDCNFKGDELMPFTQGYYFYPKVKGDFQLEVRLQGGVPSALRLVPAN